MRNYGIRMSRLFLLTICTLFFVVGCQVDDKKIDGTKNPKIRGFLSPGKIELAGTPKRTIINEDSLEVISVPGKTIVAGSPIVTPYKLNTVVAKNPEVIVIDFEKVKVKTPGIGDVPDAKTISLPLSGIRIDGNDTINAAVIKKSKYPKPIEALPMRFKDAATYNIKYLDVEQGMPSSFVYSILQDRKGNLWFGTYGGGVAKYDGKSIVAFNEKNGLNNSRIRQIYQDSNGNLWFASNGGGVTKYDGNSFETYMTEQGLSSNRVYSILEDSHGDFWFGTKGAGVIKFNGKTFTIYKKEHGLANNGVYSIIEDSRKNIWFGTESGAVSKYDGKSFTTFSNRTGLSNNVVRSIVEDDHGNLWIGSNGGGLTKYDGKSFTIYKEEDGLINNNVLCILKDKQGNLWTGTYGGGVNKFDGNNFTSYFESDGLSNSTVITLFEDNTGKIWMGTNGGGVSRYDANSFITYQQKEGLSNHTIRSILEDNKGNIWLGTDGGGISKFDGRSFTTYKEKQGLADESIYSMIFDRNGNLWAGTRRGGVNKFDGRRITIYSAEQGLPNNNIRSLREDKKGNIWFGSYGDGVYRYKDGTITKFGKREGLNNNIIRCIFEDSKGNLWFGTDGGGVSKYDGNSISTFTRNEGLANDIIMSIYEDSMGNMWFGTWGNGISKFDGKYFQNFSKEDGLTHNFILSFAEDEFGKIWIGTESGINVLSNPKGNPRSGTSYRHRTLEKSDGLKRLDIALNSVLRDSENRIWWGMGTGFTMMDANAFGKGSKISDIQLTTIDIKQEFVDYRLIGDSSYNESFTFSKELAGNYDSVVSFYNLPKNLTLPYNLNHLTFNFSAVDWLAPEKVEYQYMIPQLDDQWSAPKGENKAEYRNLPYGSYSFLVRAIGSEEIWSTPLKYTFTITPPWWHTWWARSLYVVLAILIIYGFVSWRTSNYKQQQHEMELIISARIEEINTQAEQLRVLNDKLNLANENLEKTVEKRTSELEFKNQKLSEYAFTNAHELRAPVANLLGLIQLFDQKRTPEEVDQLIELLKKVAVRLDEITYEIRDRLEEEEFSTKK